MKKLLSILTATCLLAAVAISLSQCKKPESPGSIYGVITDKATGEPIRSAGVQLNNGTKTVTGTEGQYEFTELKAGEYTLLVTKTGYTDLIDYKIKVSAGQTAKGDVQIEKLPPALKVVDDRGNEIDSLDFGSAEADITRSFGIFNDSPETLIWQITETSDWISKLNLENGSLKAGATQTIIVTIKRDSLLSGNNKTVLHVTSDNGNKQISVTAIGEQRALPALNTNEVTEITASTAKFNGVITDAGLPSYTERGFVYATSSMPTTETTIAKLTSPVTSETSYACNVTGLTLDQKYYVRAYAINKNGTSYSSNEVSFTATSINPTLSTQAVTNINIGAGTASFHGTILTAGDPAYTERGFVYGTVPTPTVDDNIKKIVSGTGTGAFSANITGLTEGETYYVRAYATNSKGSYYGDAVNFSFVAQEPELTTQAATNVSIANGTATFNGTIISIGDLPYTERGFVYGTTHNPTVEDDTKKIAAGSGTGAFSANITGLTEGETYYVRAYATNSKGIYYSNEVMLDFNAIMPILSTQLASNTTGTSATLNGTVLTIGDPAYTEKGFIYSTFPNPTIEEGTIKTVSGTTAGVYVADIDGLIIGTTYYFRAYAKSSKGVGYGDIVSFVSTTPNVVILQAAGLMVQKTDIGQGSWSTVSSMCNNSTLDGFTDWVLPTKDELATLYNERNTIGGFTTSGSDSWYWSSTPSNNDYYWAQSFSSGAQGSYGTYPTYRGRCVRKINP